MILTFAVLLLNLQLVTVFSLPVMETQCGAWWCSTTQSSTLFLSPTMVIGVLSPPPWSLTPERVLSVPARVTLEPMWRETLPGVAAVRVRELLSRTMSQPS